VLEIIPSRKKEKEIFFLIKFEQAGAKDWKILVNGNELTQLQLLPSSVTNKFQIVTSFIERVAEYHGKDFSDWFENLIKQCMDEEKRPAAVVGSTNEIKKYVNEYIENLNFDYTKFVDETKAKKNSILFTADEIKEIIKLSCYLKVYSIVSNSVNFSLSNNLHKDIYNKLAEDIMTTDIVSKIFDVVKTKTFRYNLSDKFMWEYIKTIQCKDIGIHIIGIFNFIMNHIIILCEEDKNPITYFVGVVDESVKWFLRSVYKGSIVYDDSISTEDIHGINVNNLITYSFNDTLGKMKAIAFDKIYKELEKENLSHIDKNNTDQYIIDFHNRLSNINYTSPLCTCLVFPILSRMTGVTFVHFKTISAEHAAVLSYYLNTLLLKVFKSDYRNLFQLLDYYPLTSPSINTTYKIKSIHEYIKSQNSIKNFFGFNTKTFPHKVLCHFVGRVSRINFCHLITGDRLSGIPLSKVEGDMIRFYTKMFAGDLEKEINDLINFMNEDF
jgi:hypothetical protein